MQGPAVLRPSGRASNAGASACWEITRKSTRHPCMGHPAVGTCAGGSPVAPLVGLTPLGCSGSAGCGQQDMQAAAQIPTLIAQQWRLAWGEVSHSLPGLLDDTWRQPSLPLKVSGICPSGVRPGRCTASPKPHFLLTLSCPLPCCRQPCCPHRCIGRRALQACCATA